MSDLSFHAVTPSLDNYWRAIILFGRNVASYKFALAQALTELASHENELIRLDKLAEPFSRHLCAHLKNADKQTTSRSSTFLDTCRKFNSGEITKDKLVEETARIGFANVIDAFHIVNQGEVGVRFFEDERRANNGIRLTDNIFKLFEMPRHGSLLHETEARWRLVETAWELNISRNLIRIEHDNDAGLLFANNLHRRTTVTSSRDALNGYQKGLCFYCFAPISIEAESSDLADVDHFFPHIMKVRGLFPNIDGVWNLVLTCTDCNRGANGKFARVPSLTLMERLSRRNEYLINSHHPLRQTLIQQTGATPDHRNAFLQAAYRAAKVHLLHDWQPEPKGSPIF